MDMISLDEWDQLTDAAAVELLTKLTRELPLGFGFSGLKQHELGVQGHQLGEFDFDGARFMLVPGGQVELGFDSTCWRPTAEEQESWDGTVREMGEFARVDADLLKHLAAITTPPRTVQLPACLVEVEAREVGWRPIPSQHPTVTHLVHQCLNPPEMVRRILERRGKLKLPRTTGAYGEHEVIRVHIGREGEVSAEQNVLRTHADVLEDASANGFQIPSADEWEYFCGAGARTLFRWGDHVPCDRYPSDVSPEERRWRMEWLLADGELDDPPEGFAPDWDLHHRPNAFGLIFWAKGNDWELVAEPGQRRGGDGGSSACGGEGFLKGWLPLATAYAEDRYCRRDPQDTLFPWVPRCRRVLRLT